MSAAKNAADICASCEAASRALPRDATVQQVLGQVMQEFKGKVRLVHKEREGRQDRRGCKDQLGRRDLPDQQDCQADPQRTVMSVSFAQTAMHPVA
jgi:hypothetical protein